MQPSTGSITQDNHGNQNKIDYEVICSTGESDAVQSLGHNSQN